MLRRYDVVCLSLCRRMALRYTAPCLTLAPRSSRAKVQEIPVPCRSKRWCRQVLPLSHEWLSRLLKPSVAADSCISPTQANERRMNGFTYSPGRAPNSVRTGDGRILAVPRLRRCRQEVVAIFNALKVGKRPTATLEEVALRGFFTDNAARQGGSPLLSV